MVWDAGAVPVDPVPGRFGSPWYGWHGPPSEVAEETRCQVHDLDMPCRRCGDAAEAS